MHIIADHMILYITAIGMPILEVIKCVKFKTDINIRININNFSIRIDNCDIEVHLN